MTSLDPCRSDLSALILLHVRRKQGYYSEGCEKALRGMMKQGLKERGLGVSHVPLKGSLKGLQNEIQLNKSPIELIEIVESISWGNRICHKMRLRKLLQALS
ncbi:unnamed protein product [Fusarium graminearum]|nr:hypothetical protein FG05_04472 [Fusarium graminearum]CZS82780.1 unnamed protein product [Fusarium graminearum]